MMLGLLDLVLRVVKRYNLCCRCLGRQFFLLGARVENDVKGYALKTVLAMEAHRLLRLGSEDGLTLLRSLSLDSSFNPAAALLKKLGMEAPAPQPCHLCQGIFERLEAYVSRISDEVSSGGYEYNKFLLGSRIPQSLVDREDSLRAELGLEYGESLKSELNRLLGRMLRERTGKDVDFSEPEIIILIDLMRDEITVKSQPIFIYGRYRKLIRGIPQVKWLCRSCMGKGCGECGGLGKRYPTSVEELVAEPMKAFFEGSDVKFHGAGREDVDVRMLGDGRPFIVEVKEPRKRMADLRRLEDLINNNAKGIVEVLKLRPADRQAVRRLKVGAMAAQKVYRAIVELDRDLAEEELKRIEDAFKGRVVSQRTPKRVLRRRADRVRSKVVYELKALKLGPRVVELTARCQGGIYVKEWITGDEGRTSPSISSELKAQAKCLEVDVLDVCVG